MEIADYLRVARRRAWILILVPLLAAGAAILYLLVSPGTYTSTATVLTQSLVSTPYSQFSGPQANAQFASAFAASAQDPTALARTAAEAGVSPGELAQSVTVAQVGASSNMTLSYTGRDRTKVQETATALARNALKNIYTAQGAVVDTQVEATKKALEEADKAVNDFVIKLGVGEPSSAYQSAVGQVAWLQQTQATYRASGNTDSARQIEGSIKAAQTNAKTVGAALPAYNSLRSTQTAAAATYQSVLVEQRKVQAQEAAASAQGVIQAGAVRSNTTVGSALRLVIPVFGAALLLAIVLVALFELILAVRAQPRHRASKHADEVVEAEGGAGPAEELTPLGQWESAPRARRSSSLR